MAFVSDIKKTQNIIGEQSRFEGRLLVNGSIHINGYFEGDVLKVDQLHIGESGRVKTMIDAGSVVVEGAVMGHICASIRVMLMPTARVLGDINTPELIIQNGVILEGHCHISNNVNISAKDTILKAFKKRE